MYRILQSAINVIYDVSKKTIGLHWTFDHS